MRFRPANIRLTNRRPLLPRLLLALSSENGNDKNNPTDLQRLTGALHISAGSSGRANLPLPSAAGQDIM